MQKAIYSLELVWWCIVIVVIALFLLNTQSLTHDFPFLWTQALFIGTSLLLVKHTFFFRYSFFARVQWLKVVLFFLCIPFVFKLIEYLNRYLTFIQDNPYDTFMNGATSELMLKDHQLIYKEMLFFGTAAIIVSVLFAIRLIISLWRVRNTNRV